MAYSLQEVTAVAASTGLTGDALATAVAIAGWSGSPSSGESGGNPDAAGDQSLANGKWGPSIGLWQVRSLNAERGTGATRDANRLTDPSFNARSMHAISSGGTNWQPWTIFTNGAYRKNLDQAREAAGVTTSGDLPSLFTMPSLPGLPSLPGAGALSLWPDGEMWRRIGFGALGLMIVGIGLTFLMGRASLAAVTKVEGIVNG